MKGLLGVLGILGMVAGLTVTERQERARHVNDTLDMVLEVGSDFRTQGKHPTWDEIEREAARRLSVKRVAPWERAK